MRLELEGESPLLADGVPDPRPQRQATQAENPEIRERGRGRCQGYPEQDPDERIEEEQRSSAREQAFGHLFDDDRIIVNR